MLKYFAYGSNLHPVRLGKRVPSAAFVAVVQLAGWQLHFHKRGRDGSGKCNLIQTSLPADRVYGVVYAIDAPDKDTLDQAEGLGHGYEESYPLAGTHEDAFCYAATDVDDALDPYTWYRQYVIVGARSHGLPATYVREIERVEAVVDPDATRHTINMRIAGTWCP